MSDENEKLNLDVRQDGIETLEGGIENYQQEEENEEVKMDLTFDEKKKILNTMGRKDLTDEEIENLSEDELEEINEFIKLRERKAIYKFVNRKKHVTNDDVKDLTDEEVRDMLAKSMVMARHLTYETKKTYGIKYKKKRQNRNKMAKNSRRANR